MTCKDCISYDICGYNAYVQAEYSGKAVETYITIDNKLPCRFFKEKSRYIELPCKVGDRVYYIPFGKTIEECNVVAVEYTEKSIVIKCHLWRKECEALLHKHLVYFDNNDFGKTVFLTREEAEKALAERSENE